MNTVITLHNILLFFLFNAYMKKVTDKPKLKGEVGALCENLVILREYFSLKFHLLMMSVKDLHYFSIIFT